MGSFKRMDIGPGEFVVSRIAFNSKGEQRASSVSEQEPDHES